MEVGLLGIVSCRLPRGGAFTGRMVGHGSGRVASGAGDAGRRLFIIGAACEAGQEAGDEDCRYGFHGLRGWSLFHFVDDGAGPGVGSPTA